MLCIETDRRPTERSIFMVGRHRQMAYRTTGHQPLIPFDMPLNGGLQCAKLQFISMQGTELTSVRAKAD